MDREHDRIPLSVAVKFRTTSSFLFAYSVNLSKGGMFLETANLAPVGSQIALVFEVADHGTFEVKGTVTWHRTKEDTVGMPPGMGVEFGEVDATLGEFIDEIVSSFQGLTVLLFCPDPQDRRTIGRMVRSIVATAEVVEAGGTSTAEALLGPEIDLVIVDADAPDGAGLKVLRAAIAADRKIPTIVLTNDTLRRVETLEMGAVDASENPPVFADFQEILLRTLGRPSTVT